MSQIYSYSINAHYLNGQTGEVELDSTLHTIWMQLTAIELPPVEGDEFPTYESDESALSKVNVDDIRALANAEWGTGSWDRLRVGGTNHTFTPHTILS